MSLTPYPLARPTRLCVVRHGETDWNTGKRVQGQIDIPLSALGHAQARATGNALMGEGFAAIYSSDLVRARQTAEAPLTSPICRYSFRPVCANATLAFSRG